MHSQVVLVVLTLCAVAHGKSYEGYQVFSITPRSRAQLNQLVELQDQFHHELDFWSTSPVGKPSEVMVPPYHLAKFRQVLDERQLEYKLHFPNVQQLIDEEARAISSRPRATTLAAFDYNKYHSLQEIQDWVSNFKQAESTSSLTIEEFTLPKPSYEGRAIKGLKLTTGSGRLGAYTQGGIHAREWVSPATVINLIKTFVEAFKAGDSVAVEFFSKFDWYVIPVLNVDGYHFTRPETPNNDRLWRKNRQPTPVSWCTGTDMNRNYEFEWGGPGSSGYECSEAYRGTSANSAVELKTLRDWLLGLKNNQKFMIHVDVHSYSQYWVFPFSYCGSWQKKVDHYAELLRVATAAATALKNVYGTHFEVMTSGDWYPAAGASEDFGYKILDAKYSYTIEMRDQGQYGFELPEDQIEPTGIETYAGFREFFKQVLIA